MQPTNLQTILDHFRDDARNHRDLGDRFERLILAYLQLDPLYLDRFSDVWMWNDFPLKGKVGDVGIDLVARDRMRKSRARSGTPRSKRFPAH